MKILIFIPARGGSKGIIGKNLVELKGKPLIQYTLETAQELMGNTKYEWVPFISTDDEEIASFCESRGFEMEYKRPKELATDKSPMIDAIGDALKWLNQKKNIIPDAVLLLQPTSPLRNLNDILKAINKGRHENFFSIVSVTHMREHPYECIIEDKDSWSFLAKPSKGTFGRQDYKDNFFFIDGSFYFASIDFINENQTFLIENKTQFHLLNQRWSIDIDDEDDLKVAASFI